MTEEPQQTEIPEVQRIRDLEAFCERVNAELAVVGERDERIRDAAIERIDETMDAERQRARSHRIEAEASDRKLDKLDDAKADLLTPWRATEIPTITDVTTSDSDVQANAAFAAVNASL